MKSPLTNLVQWQLNTGQLDPWTSYHLAAGAFFCKIFQCLSWSPFWCVMGVFLIGVAWEIFEWVIEDWRPYGSKKKWAYNTMSDLVVETGIAWWMVL